MLMGILQAVKKTYESINLTGKGKYRLKLVDELLANLIWLKNKSGKVNVTTIIN